MLKEMLFGKLQLISINIIGILFKASALNVVRLHSELREVRGLVEAAKLESWIHEWFILLISGLILLRFLSCFLGLVANIVAIYPILTNSQADLLRPTIIVQIFDNVVLNICEIVLGYGCFKYLYSESFSIFVIFLAKYIFKSTCCLLVLNLYSIKHHQLEMSVTHAENGASLDRDSSNEFEIDSQRLWPMG
ncbi:uncharacterized protein LOC116805426 [Drosophila grimshawi]|uniref:uncharacterized protein LOC116805426 n=1 Tax=Drosophila grimshawi TaxID=7222 RepID=UPI000C870162|nr:uncharacterized protein LOC116805426 [Drosophila grimshawi]